MEVVLVVDDEPVLVNQTVLQDEVFKECATILNDPNFDGFFDRYRVVHDNAGSNCVVIEDNETVVVNEGNVNEVEVNGNGERQDEDDEDGEDSGNGNDDNEDEDGDGDYIMDDGNEINDVEVDMRDFRLNIDDGVEGLDVLTLNGDNEDEVLDNDKFESGTESDDDKSSHLKRTLKKIRRANEGKVTFYRTQVFGTKKEFKRLIKDHSVKTRRKIWFAKDDGERVRAQCKGDIPTWETACQSSGQSSKGESSKGAGVKVDTKGKGKGPEVISEGKGPIVKNKGGRGHKKDNDKETCPWVIMASKEPNAESWVVRTCKDEHKCFNTRNPGHCTATYLSGFLIDLVRANPNMTSKAIQEHSQRELQVEVSEMKAFRAKTIAIEQINGDYQSQYGLLRDYLDELKRANPDTSVKVDVYPAIDPESNTRKFKRVYICLGGLKQGSKAIGRDLLGLDGTFLKGPFPGQVLTAVGVDPNNQIYPLAYAIVEAENKESWKWFLEWLGQDLNLTKKSNFTFISDRQKGIQNALETVFPQAEHRYCVKHLVDNMKLKFRGKVYTDAMWKLATSTTVVQFEKAMDDLKVVSKEAADWVSKIPAKNWSRAYFSGRAISDVLLNKMCEVMNSKIVLGRDKPIITVLEYIREYCMRRIVTVLGVMDRSEGLLTPYATQLFEKIKYCATRYSVKWNGDAHYQVENAKGDKKFVVNMVNKTCACRRFELNGIPCPHLVAVLWDMAAHKRNVVLPESVLHPIYRMDRWKEVYKFKVYPINGSNLWTKNKVPTTLAPPVYHKPIGRPKKARKRSIFEIEDGASGNFSKKGSRGSCKKCVNKGHNSRTCNGREEAGPSTKEAGQSTKEAGPSTK